MASTKETNKAGKANTDLTTTLGLSNRDIEVLVKGYSCMKDSAQIDYKKLADLCNFNSTESATKQWSKTRAKLKKATNGDVGDNTPTPKRKRPAVSTKDVAAEEDDDDPTPTKCNRANNAV